MYIHIVKIESKSKPSSCGFINSSLFLSHSPFAFWMKEKSAFGMNNEAGPPIRYGFQLEMESFRVRYYWSMNRWLRDEFAVSSPSDHKSFIFADKNLTRRQRLCHCFSSLSGRSKYPVRMERRKKEIGTNFGDHMSRSKTTQRTRWTCLICSFVCRAN